MHFSTSFILAAASIITSVCASPAPAPAAAALEKRGGRQYRNFGSWNFPSRPGSKASVFYVEEPVCPDPSFYGRYRSYSSGDRNRFNNYQKLLYSIPRWYAASYDVSRPNEGLIFGNDYKPPSYRDDISWIQNKIVFDYGDNGRGGFDWYRGGRKADYRLDIDSPFDYGYLDRYFNQQLGGYRSGRSRYYDDFAGRICNYDYSWFRDVYRSLPYLDESRGSGWADFYGIDRQTRYAKEVIFARDWDSRDYCRLDGSLRSKDLISIMERVNVVFKMFRDRNFIDVFTRTNIRIHGQMIRIDNKIRINNNRGVVRNNFADNYKIFIRNQIQLNEWSAWEWYSRAVVHVRVLIDEEISSGYLRGSFRDNCEQRYNRLASRKREDFSFGDNFGVIA